MRTLVFFFRWLGVAEEELLVPEALLYPEPQLPVSRGE